MSLITLSSPHHTQSTGVNKVMLQVLMALVPGIVALCLFFSPIYLFNLLIGCSTALAVEALILRLRRCPVAFHLRDLSALVTAVLLVISMPPLIPWWITVLAVSCALLLGKHLYGGLGFNPFNPAMVAFALMIVSFPVPMTTLWLAPNSGLDFASALQIVLGQTLLPDGISSATPLDYYKTQVGRLTATEIYQSELFFGIWPAGWIWVSLAYLVGGLFLLYKKVFSWHAPLGLLVGLAVLALIFGLDPDSNTPLHLHLLAGSAIVGAFFIVTDPVSGATSRLGKFIFGFGVGCLAYVIRTWGSYPDAIAFAVLLMNFAAPFIDHYSKPRTYGHSTRHQGYK